MLYYIYIVNKFSINLQSFKTLKNHNNSQDKKTNDF